LGLSHMGKKKEESQVETVSSTANNYFRRLEGFTGKTQKRAPTNPYQLSLAARGSSERIEEKRWVSDTSRRRRAKRSPSREDWRGSQKDTKSQLLKRVEGRRSWERQRARL